MVEHSNPSPTSSSRGLRIALALSVALNLAVVGVVGGALLRRDDGAQGRGMVRDLGFGQFNQALTPEDRAELRQRFVRQAPGLFHDRKAMRADLDALLAALRAD
ncbi:MAG: periplasmic heavy metal sensor, partial [Bosea sp. (in: a-proteobacteria)]